MALSQSSSRCIHDRANRSPSFFGTAGAAASLALLAQIPFEAVPVSAASLFVRRNVGGMKRFDPSLRPIAKLWPRLRALPGNNPRSWTYQAAIHGTLAGRHKMHGTHASTATISSGRGTGCISLV